MPHSLAAAAALALAAAVPPAPFDHTHAAWSAVLSTHVSGGAVDYRALARDPGGLDAYLHSLEAVSKAEYAGFSRDQRLAFWINAYNAYAVKLVLDHYPVASIKKIGRVWQSPFKIAFIPLRALGDEPISLDVIEHQQLRQELHDPRAHAAIVCASKSCPVLRGQAYTAAGIGAELDRAMRDFLADPGRNRWDPATRTLHLSSIFKWFREDFEKARGTLVGWVAAYLPEPAASQVNQGPEPAIDFLDYDWSLNER